MKGNIKRFLIRQGIHHIKEIDYTVRSRYEAELKKMWDEASVMRYLKVFDHIKQYSIQKEIESLPGRIEHRRKYQAQVVFLPYLPDLGLRILNMSEINRNWCGIFLEEHLKN